jgi:hypothetical protein
LGGEELLKSKGIEVVVIDDAECKSLMDQFIAKYPSEWLVFPAIALNMTDALRNEDIGEP